MFGGRTGRDGIGGATGSSKEHDAKSLETCGSEVQKGNAPEERKLERLFRRPEVTRLVKKSNDFGAGGVSVAIGELADGLDIYLDRVKTKYSGLNPRNSLSANRRNACRWWSRRRTWRSSWDTAARRTSRRCTWPT